MKGKFMDFSIKAQANNEAELLIYGYIGGWENRASEFARQLKELKAATLKVRINSGGGSLFDGVAIYNALKLYKGKIVVYIDALAASAASIIAMAGSERIMPGNTMLMIHNSISYADGNAKDFSQMANLLSQLDAAMATTYVSATGQNIEKIRQMMDNETWLSAKDALELGFATSVVDDIPVSASISDKFLAINGVEFNLLSLDKLKNGILKGINLCATVSESNPIQNLQDHLTLNKGQKPMDLQALKEQYPELYKQLEAQSYEKGKLEGVKAERGRIKAIEDIGINGHEKLITEAKYTNGITVEALAMQILAAEKSQKSAFIDNRQTDANDLNGITANGQPDAKSQEAEFLAVFDGEKNA